MKSKGQVSTVLIAIKIRLSNFLACTFHHVSKFSDAQITSVTSGTHLQPRSARRNSTPWKVRYEVDEYSPFQLQFEDSWVSSTSFLKSFTGKRSIHSADYDI